MEEKLNECKNSFEDYKINLKGEMHRIYGASKASSLRFDQKIGEKNRGKIDGYQKEINNFIIILSESSKYDYWNGGQRPIIRIEIQTNIHSNITQNQIENDNIIISKSLNNAPMRIQNKLTSMLKKSLRVLKIATQRAEDEEMPRPIGIEL